MGRLNRMDKFILAMLAVQTAFILLLSYLVFSMESRTSDLAYEIAASRLNTQTAQKDVSAQTLSPTSSAGSISAQDIRQIVREEVNLLAERLIKELKGSASSAVTQSAPPLISEDEIARIHASAASQISTMSSFGAATPSAMAKFEDTIVKLPPKEREAAMREFMKAVNQGEIKTRF